MKIKTILTILSLLTFVVACESQVVIVSEDINGINPGDAKQAFFGFATENFAFDANGDGFLDDLNGDGEIDELDQIGISVLTIIASDDKGLEDNLTFDLDAENEIVSFMQVLFFQLGENTDEFVSGDVLSSEDTFAEDGFFSIVASEVQVIQEGEAVSAFVTDGEDVLEIIEIGETFTGTFNGVLVGDALADPDTFDLDLGNDGIFDVASIGNVNFTAELSNIEFHVGVEDIAKNTVLDFAENFGGLLEL